MILLCAGAGQCAELELLKYNNPGLEADLGVGLWAWPLPMDFDGDGDMDLVVSCPDKPYNGTYFFENAQGAVKMPVFRPGVRVGQGHSNIRVSYTSQGYRVTTPFSEYTDFTKSLFDAPAELPVDMGTHKVFYGFGRKLRARQWAYADVNGDGASDLVVGLEDWTDYGWDNAYDEHGHWTNGPLRGEVYVALNKTDDLAPKYGRPIRIKSDGAPLETYGMPSPMFADFDGDGDMDLICGEFLDKLTWFENIGTLEKPKFAAGRFLEHQGRTITMDLEMIVPVAVDWDGDGDTDLVVSQEDGRVALIENSGRVENSMPVFLPPVFFRQVADNVKFGVLATPVSFDWDGDGDEDIVSGNSAGYIGFIENLGGAPPVWAEPVYLRAGGEVIRIQAGDNGSIQGPAEAKWGYTTISIEDWDMDGLPDILANSILGRVVWYRNTGTRTSPEPAPARPLEVEWPGPAPAPAWNWWEPEGKDLVTQWRTTPFAVDFTGDGLPDLVMLDHEGYLALFERKRDGADLKLMPGRRVFVDENMQPLRMKDGVAGKSGRRKIHVVDWDGDGLLDIIANGVNAVFLRNAGARDGKYTFEDKGSMAEKILAGHTTSPTTVNWDGNALPDLLIGAEDGHFYILKNSE